MRAQGNGLCQCTMKPSDPKAIASLLPTRASSFFPVLIFLPAPRGLSTVRATMYTWSRRSFFSCLPRLKAPTVAVDHGVSSAASGKNQGQYQLHAFHAISPPEICFPDRNGVGVPEVRVAARLTEKQPIYNGADHYSGVDDSADDSLRRNWESTATCCCYFMSAGSIPPTSRIRARPSWSRCTVSCVRKIPTSDC